MVASSFLKSEETDEFSGIVLVVTQWWWSNINKDKEQVKYQEEPGEDSPDIKVHGCWSLLLCSCVSREWPLASTFLGGQWLAKKAFDCGVEDWVLCAIQGKREGWAARERWRVLQEQTSAAEWGLLGQATRAGQGAPGPLHDSSLHQQAGLIGWGSQQDISHSGLIWDQQGPCKALKAHLLFIFPILGTQQLSGSRSLVYLPRKQKNVWTSSCNDAALFESVLPCRNAIAPSGGYHYPHTRIVCYDQMGSGHNNQICHKFCDLFSSLLHSNFFQSFCFCWENFAIPLKSNFSMDCEMQYSRAIYK